MAKVALPTPSVGLYVDPDSGKNISTNSMLKTFRRCPKQAQYKYAQRLKPNTLSLPLTRGKWMHSLFEEYYSGRDWKIKHQKLSSDFAKLFDEEKDKLGDLPRECQRLMEGYVWHYKKHSWDVKGVEQTIEAEFPDGSIFRGRYDMLVEDEFGLWLVDHKTHKTLPDFSFRLLDSQSALYLWAARQNGMKVQGFIWNYVKTTGLSKPALLQSGDRLSRAKLSTDFPTYAKAIKEYGLDPEDYREKLVALKRDRYSPDRPQTSPFFQRSILEKSDAMLDRVALEFFHTSMRMHDYDFSVRDAVERVPDRSCTYMCSYTSLCQTELFGGNTELMLRKQYSVGDPMDYYHDDAPGTDKETSNL